MENKVTDTDKRMFEMNNTGTLPVLLALAVILLTSILFVILKFCRNSKRVPAQTVPEDVVLLHHCGQGPHAPSLSPFILKLETFLRVTQTPYQIIRDYKMGPKGKVPWIEYSGTNMCDSQLCMEYLKIKLNLDLDDHLSVKEKAISTAFQRMVDEHTYWVMVHWRWDFDREKICFKQANWGSLALTVSAYLQRRAAWTQGVGRHNKEELLEIVRKDFSALSDFLGTKHFFFGDRPSCVDCSVFGQLSQFLWHLPGSEPNAMLKKEFLNLYEFCHRMKDHFWPDWNDNILLPTNS